MANMRNRSETCALCGQKREITVNLDERMVTRAEIPAGCWRPHTWCVQDMRDQALLLPHEDGKTRTR